jgi:hypothetical protein
MRATFLQCGAGRGADEPALRDEWTNAQAAAALEEREATGADAVAQEALLSAALQHVPPVTEACVAAAATMVAVHAKATANSCAEEAATRLKQVVAASAAAGAAGAGSAEMAALVETVAAAGRNAEDAAAAIGAEVVAEEIGTKGKDDRETDQIDVQREKNDPEGEGAFGRRRGGRGTGGGVGHGGQKREAVPV